MQIDVYNAAGAVVGQTELDDSVFGIVPNVAVMHQAMLRQLANARLGTHQTKTRGEVRGGGRKPWRQKGTGRARQGSIRSPQWVGGGVVWGPHPRSYEQDMPKQMSRLAIRSALSVKVIDNLLTVVEGLHEVEPRTKAMKSALAGLPSGRSTLIVLAEKSETIQRGIGNLPGVWTILAGNTNVRDLLKYERVLITREAIATIEGLWALPADKREPSRWKQPRVEVGAGVAVEVA